jgi:hypothetical protein
MKRIRDQSRQYINSLIFINERYSYMITVTSLQRVCLPTACFRSVVVAPYLNSSKADSLTWPLLAPPHRPFSNFSPLDLTHKCPDDEYQSIYKVILKVLGDEL